MGAGIVGAAHPRAGGENGPLLAATCSLAGSSPRGRGKRVERNDSLSFERLIPARAGKTRARPDRSWASPAHPRAGGENCLASFTLSDVAGSSPRGRGKPLGKLDNRPRPGLIPARAGKTCSASAGWSPSEAHPRAGGENPMGTDITIRRRRLIPARAGKTLSDLRFYRADRSDLGNP